MKGKLLKLNESQEYKAKYLIGRNSYNRRRPTSSSHFHEISSYPFPGHTVLKMFCYCQESQTQDIHLYISIVLENTFFYKKQIHGSNWGKKVYVHCVGVFDNVSFYFILKK